MGPIETSIETKLKESFDPVELFIENESHMHSGPRTESHFKVFLVSEKFEGLSRIDRQRMVNDLLKEDFEGGLHALTMRLKTPEEAATVQVFDFISPGCVSKK